jgi:DNA-binding CsgD family transcriptional regulator/tetratricopeptide (TPR) repeat protein
MVVGREAERSVLDGLLEAAAGGTSGALVLRGEPGIGKTALLEYAAGRFGGMVEGRRVLRGAGVESEAELPYAGLDLLLRPLRDRIEGIPAVQAAALRGALGLGAAVDDTFLVGLAVLSLLAESGPLLCLVDDAQWLDRASAEALLFAARRLDSEGVVILFSVRDGERSFPAPGLREMRLEGLDTAAAIELLAAHAPSLDQEARYRLLSEAAGNPLALVELGSRMVDGAGAGEMPLTERLLEAFLGQVRRLSAEAQRLLLVAALEESGELSVVLAAAGESGALAEVERAGLVVVAEDGRLAFRHPLIRAAVRQGAAHADRLAAHAALAGAADGRTDPDRRAWHLAMAATEPDEEIAAELERTAARAGERRGFSAAAAAYERSARLSVEPAARARRLTLAAEATAEAGDLARAEEMAARASDLVSGAPGPARARTGAARPGPGAFGRVPGEVSVPASDGKSGIDGAGSRAEDAGSPNPGPDVRASEPVSASSSPDSGPDYGGVVGDARLASRLALVRGMAAFFRGAQDEGHRLLTESASLIAETEPEQAAAMLIEAAHMGWYGNERALADSLERLVALRLPEGSPPAAIRDLMLLATGPIVGRPLAAGSDPAAAVERARRAAAGDADLVLTGAIGLIVGHDEVTREIMTSVAGESRRLGRIGLLPMVLFYLGSSQFYVGRHGEARATATEALRIAGDTDQPRWADQVLEVLGYLAAVSGDEAECRRLADEALERTTAVSPAWGVPWTYGALGLLDLGLGRAESALTRLQALDAGRKAFHIIATRSTPDLVEAAVRVGKPELAEGPLEFYEQWAAHTRRPWVQAMVRRCRALLSEDEAAESHFRAALDLHGEEVRAFEQARTRLLYGEWLRRGKRKADARGQLREALEAFERLGAAPWAERARTELGATGLPGASATQERAPGVLARLTPQESQIVRLAAQGLSNKDIAAQLFLSPRTVGHHLYKAYPKLGIVSRGELDGLDLD